MKEKAELNIDRINITVNEDFETVGSFSFQTESKISQDKALELTTAAIGQYVDYLKQQKKGAVGDNDFYNLIHRGFIKLGKLYDYSTIDIATYDEHKVRSITKELREKSLESLYSPPKKLDIYAIDGTPSKGYVFCRTDKAGHYNPFTSNFINYRFRLWDAHSERITHEINFYIGEFFYFVGWNPETQKKRYADITATPENMYKVTYFLPFNDRDTTEEKEFSIIPEKKSDKTVVRTKSYDAWPDGDRFDMYLTFPSFFLKTPKDDITGEFTALKFHDNFASRINNILKDDIKYEFEGGPDWTTLRYVPFEKIEDVFDVVKEWAVEADNGSIKEMGR